MDRHDWETRSAFASAIFERIEGFYNPTSHHSALGNLSLVGYESLRSHAVLAA